MSIAKLPKPFTCPKGFTEADIFPDHINLTGLTDDDELVLIKAPWDFDIARLNGCRVPLDSRIELVEDNKKIIIEASSSTNQLKNVALMLKDNERNYQIPVGQAFKKQIEIFEHYNFPAATIPRSDKIPVPSPQNLRERFTPYGSESPSIFYKKRNKKSKKQYETNLNKSAKPKNYSNDISSPLNGSVENSELSDSQTARKKKKKVKQVNQESQNENEISESLERFESGNEDSTLNESPKSKRKKKIKVKQEPIDPESENEIVHPGLLHIKSSPGMAWALNESDSLDSQETSKRKKRVKREPIEDQELDLAISASESFQEASSKRKKKRNKSASLEEPSAKMQKLKSPGKINQEYLSEEDY